MSEEAKRRPLLEFVGASWFVDDDVLPSSPGNSIEVSADASVVEGAGFMCLIPYEDPGDPGVAGSDREKYTKKKAVAHAEIVAGLPELLRAADDVVKNWANNKLAESVRALSALLEELEAGIV